MEKKGIIHGHNLELLQFMEKDVDSMEEIQTGAMGIMRIHRLLEHVVVEVKKMGNGNQVNTN